MQLNLDPKSKSGLKEAIVKNEKPWILIGLPEKLENLQKVRGTVGIVDWHVHGQVSELLKRNYLTNGYAIIAGDPNKQRASIFIVRTGESLQLPALIDKIKKLAISSLCIAESTFPKDILEKLKQNLSKASIDFSKLEPTEVVS